MNNTYKQNKSYIEINILIIYQFLGNYYFILMSFMSTGGLLLYIYFITLYCIVYAKNMGVGIFVFWG